MGVATLPFPDEPDHDELLRDFNLGVAAFIVEELLDSPDDLKAFVFKREQLGSIALRRGVNVHSINANIECAFSQLQRANVQLSITLDKMTWEYPFIRVVTSEPFKSQMWPTI